MYCAKWICPERTKILSANTGSFFPNPSYKLHIYNTFVKSLLMSISPQLVLFRYCQSNRTQHRFHWRLLQEFVPGPVRLPSFPELLRQYLDEHEQPVKFYKACFSFQFKSVLTKETSLCQALLLGDERKRGRATNAEGSWEEKIRKGRPSLRSRFLDNHNRCLSFARSIALAHNPSPHQGV